MISNSAVILMYHRVGDYQCDPWNLAVTRQRFTEHMEIVRKHFRPVPLQELVACINTGSIPDGTVVITFDDGYLDNITHAVPILERYDIPATIFVVSRALGRQFWWDELEKIFLTPGTLPAELRLSVRDTVSSWNLNGWTCYTDKEYLKHQDWKTWQPQPTARHWVFLAVWEQLKILSDRHRSIILQELRRWAGITHDDQPQNMSPNDISALGQSELIEIGCHTASHERLSAIASEEQDREIQEGKAELETLTGSALRSFAYPYGENEDYTSVTLDLVKKAGFSCACTTIPGATTTATDPFQLPRMHAGGWNGAEFLKELTAFFNKP
jgi:peptidoglycan/xylan/chitin deacetylase (PgdA/CDA1 family)